ncbi:unnamed protein product [Caenorhabditis angaria]|uniref:SXP/RAL-2 family protein Ani s 5-like cation-binding domain-containing protein n=1 Tax=Caenorhabditis angaria TaxID=860376 RepID=A0A9P1J0B6_9PELO|nr:unnamed protein product [Caenorhabditis angaria]
MFKLLVFLCLFGVIMMATASSSDEDYLSENSESASEENAGEESDSASSDEDLKPRRHLKNPTSDEDGDEDEEEDSHIGIRRVNLGSDLHGVDTKDYLIRGDEDEQPDMKLVEPKIDSYGKLKYESLPLVEDNIVDELSRKIMSNDAFKAYLGNPDQEQLENYLRDVLKKPSQKVMQEQILWKLLGIKAYYNQYVASLTNADQKKKVVEFLVNLLKSKSDADLTGQKTVDLNNYFDRLAFLLNDPDVSKQFQSLLDSFVVTTPAPATVAPTIAAATQKQKIAATIAPITGVPK